MTSPDNIYYLNIIFRNYDKNSKLFSNYLTNVQYQLNYLISGTKTHDLKKYSENKICFINKVDENLNVFLINLYEVDSKVVIREYNINIYK